MPTKLLNKLFGLFRRQPKIDPLASWRIERRLASHDVLAAPDGRKTWRRR